jgi:Ca-activated chloride channel homolog
MSIAMHHCFRIITVLLFVLTGTVAYAQQPVQIWFPKQKSEQPIRVESLRIDANVTALVAQTRMELEFYNPNARVLEGEFILPLLPNQTVVGYALEVDGKLREGVVVPKEKARVAFESITRRGVDPGLAELTRGNVFRTRIYPIPANGKKRISITIDQNLINSSEGLRYEFPVPIKTKLARFDVRVQANQSSGVSNKQLVLSDAKIAERSQQHVVPEPLITLTLPKAQILAHALPVDQNNQSITLIPLKAPTFDAALSKAKNAVVYWDASRSGASRDHDKELRFLQAAIAQHAISSIKLVVFRNTLDSVQTFSDANSLIKAIRGLSYDGGSAIHSMGFDQTADLAIIFTDGDSNFDLFKGNRSDASRATRTVIAHAAMQINANGLAQLSERLNAGVIPLLSLNSEQQLTALKEARIKATVAIRSGGCADFPIVRQLQGDDYLLSARCTPNSQFDVIWSSITATRAQALGMPKAMDVTKAQAAPLARLFGAQRVQYLAQTAPVDEAAIQEVAVEFGVVSEWTSLLVLESIADYIEFEVEPMEPDLLAQFKSAIDRKHDQRQLRTDTHLRNVLAQWQEFKTWHSTPRYVYTDVVAQMASQLRMQMNGSEKALKQLQTLAQQAQALKQSKMHLDALEAQSKQLYLQMLALQTQWLATLPKARREAMANQLMQATTRDAQNALADGAVAGGAADRRSIAQSAPMAASAPAPTESTSAAFEESALDLAKPIAKEQDALAPDPGPESATATKARIELKGYRSDAPYIRELRTAKNAYESFLIAAKADGSAGFYLDCAEFFFAEKKDPKLALRVLSNIAETQVESVDALRVLGAQLMLWKQQKLALTQFELAKNLRVEEPQGWRDLALALDAAGYHKQAQATLWHVIANPWDERFESIALTALHEFNEIYFGAPANQRVNATEMGIPKAALSPAPVGLRVVMGWNANDVDMDLWVLDPSGEWAFYGQPKTLSGGQMSRDFTAGYGPETFTIAKPIKGRYRVFANYFANHQQKLAVPISVYLSFQTPFNIGKTDTQNVVHRLDTNKQVQEIGSFTVE